MLRFVARHLGTLLPLGVMLAFIYAAVEAHRESFTWERPTLYLVAIVSLVFGIRALVQLARRPKGRHPTVLMVTFIYEKVTVALTFVALTFAAANSVLPWVPAVPVSIVIGLFASTAVALVVNNVILYAGERLNFYDEPCDPAPFRQPFRAVRDYLRRIR